MQAWHRRFWDRVLPRDRVLASVVVVLSGVAVLHVAGTLWAFS